jgi:hypothetical protein|tara:strand:+ start:617 stop:907 length:291 start_codon:yes stop_codon:yes gene_type:complete
MASQYANAIKIDFAIFKNQYKDNDKAPIKSGKIEFTREFLKEMVSHAKEGEMPTVKVAIWNRTSKKGVDYENARLEILPIQNVAVASEEEDDGLPF